MLRGIKTANKLEAKDRFCDTLSFEKHLKLEGHQKFREHKASLLRKFLPQQSFASTIILDVGCGSGFDLKTFKQQGFDAVELDLSLNMLRQARKYLGKADIDLLIGNMLVSSL